MNDVVTAGLIEAGLIAAEASLDHLSDQSTWAEGPCWIPESQRLRWSDIIGNRVMEWSWETGETVVQLAGAEHANGRILDRNGDVVQCSHGRRRVERVRGDEITSIVSDWQGVRLNSPNDLVVTRDGAVWFTDPDYGLTSPGEGHPGDLEYDDHWVFRIDEATGDYRPVILDADRPNGLVFSPDESILYIADSGTADIRAYDVVNGHRCKDSRIFAKIESGVPDGMRVDEHGNLWSTHRHGVIVFAPDATEIGRIAIPEVTANLCWGGPTGQTLFFTATTGLYRLETLTRDAHLRR
ncbi:SMP-30/gluconolactonase/LRE family protein [Frondihabitans peucedani]|uniref:SMP-30/gluconolactonase/LRE family protein n=1 Tax=Frondihabitans peucedani TaxID=598626 RepID=A0ABP8E0M3_9MICO